MYVKCTVQLKHVSNKLYKKHTRKGSTAIVFSKKTYRKPNYTIKGIRANQHLSVQAVAVHPPGRLWTAQTQYKLVSAPFPGKIQF